MKFLIIFLFIISFSIYGADTTETFGLGFTDFECYHTSSSLNKNNKVYTNQATVGIGITHMFSASFQASSEKTNGEVSTGYGLGFFINTFDTEHFDFDLYTYLDNSYAKTFGFELNLDLKDELELAGLYLRTELSHFEETIDYSLVFGAYYSFLEDFQALLQFDMSIPESDDFNIGGLTLGLNYTLSDKLEIISEFSLDIPQDDEKTDYALMIGFLSTLP